MLSILEPLKPYYSEEKARLTLGVTMAHYDIGATWMEAFSRPLWGLVPFWAGGGKEPEFEEIYRKGLTAGTDEKNPEYWGECTSLIRDSWRWQPFPMALCLPPKWYGILSRKHRRRISATI